MVTVNSYTNIAPVRTSPAVHRPPTWHFHRHPQNHKEIRSVRIRAYVSPWCARHRSSAFPRPDREPWWPIQRQGGHHRHHSGHGTPLPALRGVLQQQRWHHLGARELPPSQACASKPSEFSRFDT